MSTKMAIDFSAFGDLARKLEEAGGDVQSAATDALRASFDIVTPKAEEGMQRANLPAKGKYSTGKTLNALMREPNIRWENDIGTTDVGFSIRNGGLASQFLIHGTPRMRPAKKLHDAFYSKTTQREVSEAQENIIFGKIHEVTGL